MTLFLCLSLGALSVSLIANGALFTKLKKTRSKKVDSVELSEFLMDLRSGWAMLAVKRLDPNEIVLRSPRQR